jgi:ferredoxin-NADP reductase
VRLTAPDGYQVERSYSIASAPERTDGIDLAIDAPRRAVDFGRRVDPAMVVELMTRLPALPRHVFVCGGNPFVEAASDGAIAAGIDPNMIRTERFGG